MVEAKTRKLVEDPAAEVTIDVILPAETEQRLQLAEQLCEDAQRELEEAILELRNRNISVPDIGFVLLTRRLRPDPKPLMITNAEIAESGLSRHPDAVGVRWSDHGFAETTKCRRCVEAMRSDYEDLPEDGTNELLYDKVDCDFFDADHLDADHLDEGEEY